MNRPSLKTSSETQYNRACDACRQHKVRCIPDNLASSSSKICQRCSRTDRSCVFTAPQKRKQRKRTDTRVAELEKEVQAMRALFNGKKEREERQFYPVTQTTTSLESRLLIETICETDYNSTASQASSSVLLAENSTGFCSVPQRADASSPKQIVPIPEGNRDVIERGILSEQLATTLFHTYVEELAPHSPFVVFPSNTTANDIRSSRPTLFLAVIAAASGKSDPSLFSILSSEVLSSYTKRTVVNSEKSLELVQAMLITSVWYYPPGRFAQLKFYEYIHMAATMAMDLGLGTKPFIKRLRRGQEERDSPPPGQSTESYEDLEKKRTFLSCYLVCTG